MGSCPTAFGISHWLPPFSSSRPALLLIAFRIFFLITFGDQKQVLHLLKWVSRTLFAVAVMLAISLPFLWLARRFVLGKRRLVLFLRRFRRRSALATVSRAAMPSSGFGLRIVTLDDGASAKLAGEAASRVITTKGEIDLALSSRSPDDRKAFQAKKAFCSSRRPAGVA